MLPRLLERGLFGALARIIRFLCKFDLGFDVYDQALTTGLFISTHKRLPKRNGDINDFLYEIKRNGELKLPERGFVTDKEFAKIFVRGILGDDFVIPTIAVLHTEKEIQEFDFPERCVAKSTQSSGEYIVLPTGSAEERTTMASWLKSNLYLRTREWNYQHLKPKIIVEELVFDQENVQEFKIFCRNGVAKVILTIEESHTDARKSFFSRDWKYLEVKNLQSPSDRHSPMPPNLTKMIEISEQLAAPFSSIRIDLYSNGTAIKVGELTNCHNNASSKYRGDGAKILYREWILGRG